MSIEDELVVTLPHSPRIVRSTGCVALAILLATTTSPTFGATAPRDIESLGAAERASLPDATLIKLKGRTVSLGALRAEHTLRLQRFAAAAKLGAQTKPDRDQKSKDALVPMNFSLRNFVPAPKFQKFPGPLPADYVAFCKGAAATACLYFPKAFYSSSPYSFEDDDYFVTDRKLCQSEGGIAQYGDCLFYYPVVYNLSFNPGKVTAHGYPVTHSATCRRPFSYTVDPHGGVGVSVYDQASWNNTSLKTCVVRVFVKK